VDILYALEKIRTPFWNGVMSAVTQLGGEVIFIVAAVVVFWCVSKWEGYYLMTIAFCGTVLNQFLKLICRVPRPWVRDPNFTIVESARAEATGYSFPSGHTQNALGLFGGMARWGGRRWVAGIGINVHQQAFDGDIAQTASSLDLLTINALAAADGLLVPVEPEEYAVAGISDLLGTVQQVQRSYNPTLEVLGVLLTRCDRRRSSVQQVRDDLIAALGDKVFDAMIPYLTEASNAPRERRSCVSKPGSEIGRAYMAVAKEVLVR